MLHCNEKILWCAIAALVVFQACSKQAPKQFVARVDQSLLTGDDLVSLQDSSGRVPQHEREYIAQWVTDELLYLEARRRGLADDPQLHRRIDAATQKLVIGALLEHELYAEENVSEDEVVALYNGGGNALRLREDVVNVSYAVFDDRDPANAFRGTLLRGSAWNIALAEVQKDSSLHPHLLQVATQQYFTESTLFPIELWKLATTLGKGEVSFAARTSAGYYVLVVHNMKKQGEMPDLEYVRDELRGRILVEQRRTKYERLLSELRTRHSIEIHYAEGDSSVHANEIRPSRKTVR